MQTDIMDEIRGHLGAALAQSIEKDDPIIMGHVLSAYLLAGGKLEWLSSQRGMDCRDTDSTAFQESNAARKHDDFTNEVGGG